jgi:hypothetical protein
LYQGFGAELFPIALIRPEVVARNAKRSNNSKAPLHSFKSLGFGAFDVHFEKVERRIFSRSISSSRGIPGTITDPSPLRVAMLFDCHCRVL